MIFNIRRGVFETNSSSVHALSVFKLKEDEVKDVPKVINLTLSDYTFGWDVDYYKSFDAKLAYFILVARYSNDRDAMISKINALLYAVGVEEINIEERHENEADYYDGYVDHGNEAIDFVKDCLDDVNLFYGFLFNDDSEISTGNDNRDGECPDGLCGADYTYYKEN